MNEDNSTLEEDPFDRLYMHWAEQAMRKHLDPPSRERWDEIVLRLISSEDPERVRLYRRIEAVGDDTLGGDAFALWSKMPTYTTNRNVPAKTVPELAEYAAQHRGSMRRLMESKGLGDKYISMVEARKPTRSRFSIDPDDPADKPRVRRSQMGVLVIGCVGMGALLLMLLTALLLIGLGVTR
ncbi:MAG: hypothetical protein QOH93_558 [Chloroflexia bacterium]|nr:hypothetical protein [Chloroflexia bacterium]